MAKAKQSGVTSQYNAIEMLKEDHDKVKKLFKDFEQTDDIEERQHIVDLACAELTIHTQLEEEIFYPAVRAAVKNDDMLNEAAVEHAAAKHLINELQSMPPDDELFSAKFTVLGEYVKHHIKEEEDEMFPSVNKSKLDVNSLGQEMQDYKQDLQAEQFEEDTGQLDEFIEEEEEEQEPEEAVATPG